MPEIGDMLLPAGDPAGYTFERVPVWRQRAHQWQRWLVAGYDGDGLVSDRGGHGYGWSPPETVEGWRQVSPVRYVTADGQPIRAYRPRSLAEIDAAHAEQAALMADREATAAKIRAENAARDAADDETPAGRLAIARHGKRYGALTRSQRRSVDRDAQKAAEAEAADQHRSIDHTAAARAAANPFAALAALRGTKS